MPTLNPVEEGGRNRFFDHLYTVFVVQRGDDTTYRALVRRITSLPEGYLSLPPAIGAGLEAAIEGHDLTRGMEYLDSYFDSNRGEVTLFATRNGIYELTVDEKGNKRLTLIDPNNSPDKGEGLEDQLGEKGKR